VATTTDRVVSPRWLVHTLGASTPLTLAALGVGTLALRVPLLAPRLAHWDAVNYALGLHVFDVAAHQPHPPGSPYFILLGRAALALVGDDNLALELVSLLASAAAVIAEYTLARLLFGTRAALLAAVLLLTQPVFWGYGTTASAWTLLALCSICIAIVSALLLRGNTRLVYPSALLMAVVSGFRADAALFLAPLWLWCLFSATRAWRTRAVAIGIVVVGVLVWLVPVSASAGGAVSWSERLLALLPAPGSSGAEVRQLAANTAIALGTLAFGLGPALLMGLLLRKHTITRQTGLFLALWIVPAFTFLWLVDSTEPGHDLVFVGAIAAIGAGLLRTVNRWYALALAAVQAAVFLFAAPLQDRPLAWTLDSMLFNVTAPGLRQQQTSLDDTLRTIRSNFSPSDTLVITLLGQDPYRFLMYYLPEYSVVRLDPRDRAALTARYRAQGNWTELSGGCLSTPRHAVVVLSTPSEPGTIPTQAVELSPTGGGPFQVWLLTANEYLGFKLGDCA
jgi:dolichyl-phosphate-mannose-protein mannosyltransferase